MRFTSQPVGHLSRTVRSSRAVAAVAWACAAGLFGAGCVAHPVGPARTFGKYEGKAVTTAKGALSATRTATLVAKAASKGNAFGPYTANVVADAEDQISGLTGTFDSIQPPDDHADRLRGRLDDLLSQALSDVQDLRVAARRGQLGELADMAKPVEADADALNAFIEAHQ